MATVSSPAAATHMEEPGENVTLEYDQSTLDTYRPRLVLPSESREKLLGLYGWVARSEDYDTDVCVYWCSYSHQEGWIGNLDSHWGDHEPLHVVYDSQSGEVRRVRASVYHWVKGEVTVNGAPMYDDTHPHLRVFEPWHQFTAARPADSGTFYDVEDLTETYPRWLSNGLEESVHPGSSTVPWRMSDREHWWRDRALGVSLDASLVALARSAGIDEEGQLQA